MKGGTSTDVSSPRVGQRRALSSPAGKGGRPNNDRQTRSPSACASPRHDAGLTRSPQKGLKDQVGAAIVSVSGRRVVLWFFIPILIYLGMTISLQMSMFSREIQSSSSSSCEIELLCRVSTLQPPTSNHTKPERGMLHHVFRPHAEVNEKSVRRPNYGGLHLRPVNISHFHRIIHTQDSLRYHEERKDFLASLDRRGKPKFVPYDDLDWPRSSGCRRARTAYTSYPTCNSFHERPLGVDDPRHSSTYLGRGYYRTSWSLVDLAGDATNSSDVVLKNQRLREENDFDDRQFEQIRVEAMSMERTTASDRTTNIYGHCGTSILVERAFPIERKIIDRYYFPDLETVEGSLSPGEDGDDVRPKNSLTPEQKLAVALAMAEGLAFLHGNYDGVIVNDDIQISQWLLGRDGKLKLNDFNKAVIMSWSDTNQTYCTFYSQYKHQYRAPEELRGTRPVDETADVFSYGQTLYTVLTGLVPFYERGSREAALKANKYGYLPYVDPRYRNRSLIEGRLVEIMEPCYQYRREDRIGIFEVVAHLRETVHLYERRFPHAPRIADVPLWDLIEDGYS